VNIASFFAGDSGPGLGIMIQYDSARLRYGMLLTVGVTATDLHADCSNCFGLCCVGLAFAQSSDFAFDKPVGTPCHNLKEDFGCRIHDKLRPSGMGGCTIFDCFGAGQKISQVTFHGRSWREAPVSGPQMFLAFSIMRTLHELLWYITDALSFAPEEAAVELQIAFDRVEELTNRKPAALFKVNSDACREDVNALLTRISDIARAEFPDRANYDTATLDDKTLEGADLRGASFRNADLRGADLSNADLRHADVIGAKMRHTNLRGADLSTTLFLTQMQINAADGDISTLLSERLYRPSHWN
jgi:uncharacterized protein YjbI with pentapeptide repeats